MLKKTFEKKKAGLGCNDSIFGLHMFTKEMKGYLDEVVWGFLKKGMKVYPHKHPDREVYIFVNGRGIMKVDEEEFLVAKGDAVYIEPNSLHTTWNNEDTDLEFILLRTKGRGHLPKKLSKVLSFLSTL